MAGFKEKARPNRSLIRAIAQPTLPIETQREHLLPVREARYDAKGDHPGERGFTRAVFADNYMPSRVVSFLKDDLIN